MSKTYESSYDLTDRGIISIIDDLPLWSAPFGLKLLDTIKYKNSITALDIGSGNGFPVVEIASRLGNSCKVYGIDPWEEANVRTEQKIQGWSISNLSIIKGKAEELPFTDNYFDLITSNNGINNVQDEAKVWSEISRVSKHGSQFVFTLNLPESMIEFYNVFIKVLEKYSMFNELDEVENHIYNKRKPLDHFYELLDKYKFKLNRIAEDVFSFTYADGTAMLNHFFIKLAFRESWIKIVPEEKAQEVFTHIEKELNDLASARGCLKLTIPFVCFDTEKV